jgi:hypothetical protein
MKLEVIQPALLATVTDFMTVAGKSEFAGLLAVATFGLDGEGTVVLVVGEAQILRGLKQVSVRVGFGHFDQEMVVCLRVEGCFDQALADLVDAKAFFKGVLA